MTNETVGLANIRTGVFLTGVACCFALFVGGRGFYVYEERNGRGRMVELELKRYAAIPVFLVYM